MSGELGVWSWERAALLAACCLLPVENRPANGAVVSQLQTPNRPLERGRFLLFKLQQRVGEETYEITRDTAGALTVNAKSTLAFLGGDVPLVATLELARDLTPRRFEVKGRTSTLTHTDNAVEVRGRVAHVRRRGALTEVPRPPRFFTISHYGPAAIEQMLFRYWIARGRPARLPILPAGEVRIERRGRDTVRVGNRRVVLERYSVSGVVWGRQSAWLDSARNLIAIVNGDAELDRFEAIREGYEASMPVFVAGSVRDGLADLSRVAARIRPIHQGTFALVGGTLIDGTGAAPIENSVVVIANGRIAAAGPRSRVAIGRGIPTVDATGKTLLPGLWDMHGHYEQVEWPAAALAAGVTTVRDAANEFELVKGLRDAIRDGRALGPRVLVAGVIDGGEHPLGVQTASTPDEARAVVGKYYDAGFQQIKIYQSLKPELVKVVAAEAHRLGMTVTGHVPTGMNALEFVQAGADQINHLNFVTAVLRPPPQNGRPSPVDLNSAEAQRAIALLKERGTVLDPSLARGEQHAHPSDTAFARYEPGAAKAPVELIEALNTTGVPTDVGMRGLANLERSLTIVGALHKAGIPIVLGTDLVVPGHSIHRELELAVRAGLTPMQAIQAATLVPARAMKLEKESGTIEPGKRADVLIIAGNPLESIGNTRKVDVVIANGRMFAPAELWRSVGFRP